MKMKQEMRMNLIRIIVKKILGNDEIDDNEMDQLLEKAINVIR
jgi:hypothetical protein